MKTEKKYNETIIIRDGRPLYAISVVDKSVGDRKNPTYIYMYNGRVFFSENWISGVSNYDMGDEAHRIAKEMFVSQLQTDIKSRILELKQLENIFENLGLPECFGTVLVDNTAMLQEIKGAVEEVKNGQKQAAVEAIQETVRGIALKPNKTDAPESPAEEP